MTIKVQSPCSPILLASPFVLLPFLCLLLFFLVTFMKCLIAPSILHSSIYFSSSCPSFPFFAVLLPSACHPSGTALVLLPLLKLFLFVLPLTHSSQKIWKNYSGKRSAQSKGK